MRKIGLDDFLVQAGPFHQESLLECERIPLDHSLLKEMAAWYQRWEKRQREGGEKGLIRELADVIVQYAHFAQDRGACLYVFERGCYRPHGREVVARYVKQYLLQNGGSRHWKSHLTQEVVEYLRVDAPRLFDRPSPARINLRNGLFDITTRTLQPHDPSYLTTIQLPVTYDPAARCPYWDAFLEQVLPEDCIDLVYEILGQTMRGDISDQSAVLGMGEGRNGKSTFLAGVQSLLGRENVANVPLQRLESDRFAAAQLVGKLANICADLPSEHLASTSMFKALVGGDRIHVERKYGQPFEYTPFARPIFSSNHYPRSRDASKAFFRRWIVIPFERTIVHQDCNPHLAQELADQTELSGLLNRILAVLPALATRGRFTQSETSRLALMEFQETTDPLAVWLDIHTVLAPDGYVSKTDLAIAYNAAANKVGSPSLSAKALYKEIRRLRPTIKEGQRVVCGKMKDVFLGLTLKDAALSLSPVSAHSAHSTICSDLEIEAGIEGRKRERDMGNELNQLNPLKTSAEPCWACGQRKYWRSTSDNVICGVCHPPAAPELVEAWV